MLTMSRRCLVFAALMFWQGGFTFYAAVVVPVGQQVLGSHLVQGFITRQVTNYLNLAGGVALVILGWEMVSGPAGWRRWLETFCWFGMVLLLAALVWLHPQMEELLDFDSQTILHYRTFRTEHRWYLWLSTIQWGLALVYAVCMLDAWRLEDSGRTVVSREEAGKA